MLDNYGNMPLISLKLQLLSNLLLVDFPPSQFVLKLELIFYSFGVIIMQVSLPKTRRGRSSRGREQ